MDLTKSFNIIDFGALPGENINPVENSKALQAAIDECSNTGGGKVIIPQNLKYITSPFNLKSNVALFLEKGSEIIASPEKSHYLKSAFRNNLTEGSIWIGGENLENISITGTGTINGNGIKFMGAEEKAAYALKPFKDFDQRPHAITLIGCKNLEFRDFILKDSAYWGIHLVGCNEILIDNIRIRNNLKIRNSDGIDLDHSKNVKIMDCTIESGDDSICLKNRREYAEFGACENILIENCTMTSTSCAFKIGSENIDYIKNITVKNCKIERSNRGIGIQHRDEGLIENISFSNIDIECRLFDEVWWGKAEPIYITAFKRASNYGKDSNLRFAPGQNEGNVGLVNNIRFSNCYCKSENGIYISGEPGKINNIEFKNVEIILKKITDYPGGIYDRRPCDIEGIIKAPTAGFYMDTANKVILENCVVSLGKNKPDTYKKGLIQKNVTDLTCKNFEEKNPFK